jgi:voltage-gated potassium channel Kch
VLNSVSVLAVAAMLAAGFRVAMPGTRIALLGIWATAIWAAFSLLTVLHDGVDGALGVVVFAGILGALSVWCTLHALFRQPDADLDGLFGAVFGYFLVALVFSQIYVGLEMLAPGSFVLPDDGEARDALLYFSLVTLTTLGYGDIVPVSPVARLAAGVEAAVGTLYIAILIGRIVGAMKPQGPRG